MKREKILVGSPVCQKPAILEAFLGSLKGLRRDGITMDYLFVDDNTDPASSRQLASFERKSSVVKVLQGAGQGGYVCDAESHHWDDSLMLRVAHYKNKIIQYAIEQDYDALFFVDSDLVLHPELVLHLRRCKKQVVSEVFWTRWHEGLMPEPNVWLFDEYDLVPKQPGETVAPAEAQTRQSAFLEQLRQPGLYNVGGLGACTLVERSALLQGVNFSHISNLTIHGEDRFFCIRAAVLGIALFVDTCYPAYHIYREPDLAGVSGYKKQCAQNRICGTITLTMIVKNEAHRYLERVLKSLACHIDAAVIIDDASTDETVNMCETLLQDIPLTIVKNETSLFANEVNLRKLQWDETVKTNPDWILNLDADELIEPAFWKQAQAMVQNPHTERCCFRLYDMWSETHYREDALWCAHKTSRTFMVRYRPEMNYRWKETPQHCGRFPASCEAFRKADSACRVQHFGWATAADRHEKYERYKRLDPQALYGVKAQYDSILDEAPALVEWCSDES